MIFRQKNNKTQQQENKKSNIKSLPEPGIEPGASDTKVWSVTSGPLSQLIEVKTLKITVNVQNQNITKQH